MKKYKFITMRSDVAGGWGIRNNRMGDLIGWIEKCPQWKQYVFTAAPDSIWSASCLRDIIDFIENEIPS
jgi:hypothetical protein